MITHFLSHYLMVFVFAFGYLLITLEHFLKVNKATIALLMAIFCWIIQFSDPYFTKQNNLHELCEHLSNISQVIFFLLGALTVVEIINAHHGFQTLSNLITVSSKKAMLWSVGIMTFFLSAVLDNLTTTIVMVSLLQKLIPYDEDRLIIGGGIVIAANAGGAWTPIGDVTTTMLWIGGQLSTTAILKYLFAPSMLCLIVSLSTLSYFLKGSFNKEKSVQVTVEPFGQAIFWIGISSLILVPFFKMVTGLPPFMGMLFALGIMWLITDLLHHSFVNRDHLRVPHVLSKVDLTGVLFFLGILLCIDALQSAGLLDKLGNFLSQAFNNLNVVAIILGIISAIIDNVPLVAAAISMYPLSEIPQDHSFWLLTAYAAGTGGSMLIIGSAAGIIFMGLEKVDFFWYLKKISLAAALGYFAGIIVYLLQ